MSALLLSVSNNVTNYAMIIKTLNRVSKERAAKELFKKNASARVSSYV